MQMEVSFPGGERVDAQVGSFTIHTDQPSGGDRGSAPAPFTLFLASLATCAGIYVLQFCRQRDLPIEGLLLVQRSHYDRQAGRLAEVEIEIQLPPGFPEKYHAPVIRAAELCAVKKLLDDPPSFNVFTSTPEGDR